MPSPHARPAAAATTTRLRAAAPQPTGPDTSLAGILASGFRASLTEKLRREPRQARAIQTLEALLAAAEHLFRRNGLAGLTVEAIAAEAQVATPAVYRYFETVEALLWVGVRLMQIRMAMRLVWRMSQQHFADVAALAHYTADELLRDFNQSLDGLPDDWQALYKNHHEINYVGLNNLAEATIAAAFRNGLCGRDVPPLGVTIALASMVSAFKLLRRQDPYLVEHAAARQTIVDSYVVELGARLAVPPGSTATTKGPGCA
jgi:AcrR family transcriptional regulator